MESLDELRDRRFLEAQEAGWVYGDTVTQRGEGYGRKPVIQFTHPCSEPLLLFIGPRGGMKTGRSYSSSACRFWEHTPLPSDVHVRHSEKD